MQVTLKMWTPKGTMVEILEELPQGAAGEDVTRAEAYWLQAGFTSQRPDHTYPVKEQVIEGIVVVETNSPFDDKGTQKVLYLYTDNPKLEYAEFTCYPEHPWYGKLASILNMDNVVSGQAPRKGDMHTPVNSRAWQKLGRKARFIPQRNAEGQLVFRKKKNSDQRKEWPEYVVDWVDGFTNGNAPSPAANGNGAQRTQQAGATPDATWGYPELVAWAWNSGACANQHEAENSLKKQTREVFGVNEGEERAFLLAATPDKHETLKNNYILHQQEKLAQKMGALEAATSVDEVAEGEEIPF